MITPYRQFIEWVNPIALVAGVEAAFDLGGRAEYDLYLGQLSYTNVQAFQELNYDLAGWIQGMFTQTATIGELLPNSTNFGMSNNAAFLSDFVMFSPNTIIDPLGNWTGTQQIWKGSVNGVIGNTSVII